MGIIDTVSRVASALLIGALAACGGSDPSVGSQDITFAIVLDSQPDVAQGGSSDTAARIADADPPLEEQSADEREAFMAAVSLRLVDPMPPGVSADFAPGTLRPEMQGTLQVRASADAQAGRHQLVAAGTLAGGSTTTRYVAHIVQVIGRCAAATEPIREVFPSRMARTIALSASGNAFLWGHNTQPDFASPDDLPPVPRTLAFYTAQVVPGVSPAVSAASGGGVSVFVQRDSGALRVLVQYFRSGVAAPGGANGWQIVEVPGASGFEQVVARQTGFYLRHRDGTVWQLSSFLDEAGQLRLSPPAAVTGFSDVTLLAAGTRHLLALKRDGTVLAFGSNDHGQIGDGSTATALAPVPVPGLTGILRIAAGDEHSLALRDNGTALAWGRGDSGQIGDGFRVDALRPLEVISAGGNVITGVIDVTAGSAHSVLHLASAEVLAWGRGTEGQLGNGTLEALNPTAVDRRFAERVFAAGYSTFRVEFSSGRVQAWGDNAEGLLGDGSVLPRAAPVSALGLGTGEGRACREE